jgi:hypothetical protein
MFQYDIKRIMPFQPVVIRLHGFRCGIGQFNFRFSIWSTRVFQGTSFLCAGSVIHAIGDQDIRRMGAYLSITYNI